MTLTCTRQPRNVALSAKVAGVALQFGIPATATERTILDSVRVRLGPGRIILFQGPSGSGKSTALEMIARQCSGGCSVQRVRFPAQRSVIDSVATDQPLPRVLELLAACGLGEAPVWVRSAQDLSDGQRFRASLARGIGLHARSSSVAPLICDEFCAGLHRRVAKAIAYNLRKLTQRHALSLEQFQSTCSV